MRAILLSVAVVFTACGSSSSGDSPGAGGTSSQAGHGGSAGASAGRAGATQAGATDSEQAGEGGTNHGGDAGEVSGAGVAGEVGLGGAAGVGIAGAAAAEAGNAGTGAGNADAGAGGAAPTCPKVLLVGGADVTAQGWATIATEPKALTYGADYVQLQTSTRDKASSGGQLLLSYPNAVQPDEPFKLSVELEVDSVNVHNPLDSAAAILGSFTPSAGTPTDRSQMLYLDPNAVGWADNTSSAMFHVTDGGYHRYELSVNTAHEATVRIDGSAVLARGSFTTNGTIAIGDQTNDANFDSTLRIRSVTLLCP